MKLRNNDQAGAVLSIWSKQKTMRDKNSKLQLHKFSGEILELKSEKALGIQVLTQDMKAGKII